MEVKDGPRCSSDFAHAAEHLTYKTAHLLMPEPLTKNYKQYSWLITSYAFDKR